MFRSGASNYISWQPTGGQEVILCNFRHQWSESDEGHEVTSSCHDGVQAFIASILRGEGSAAFHIRDGDEPWNVGIVAGASGVFRASFGNIEIFVIPAYVGRINYENEVAGGTDYSVNFKLNAEAGTYSRP